MNKKRNCIYIPSIDAKDLYLANNFLSRKQNQTGYRLTTQKGEINYNRFINSLDFSLDSEKLREIVSAVYQNGKCFSFMHNGKEYSDKIINVTFKYNSRVFNKVRKNTYVMDGYCLDELTFTDNIALDEEMTVGVITSTPVQNACASKLPEGFVCALDDEGNHIYEYKSVGVTCSKKELRDYLYEKGFQCNGNHYIRFKRTSGSARAGKCLFIEESLYPEIHKWEMCGLEIHEEDPVDLAALEAYISLPTSSAIDTLAIDPSSILIIPDYDSRFQEDSVIVGMDENNRLTVREGAVDISNSIFDGQSLIDKSIMGPYQEYGMVLLRNRFFKSCCFNTNIQKWFEDNNIQDLSQLHPDSITLAVKIEDIRLITTPNSIKYAKFAPILNWLHAIDPVFSVVKHEKKTHFFNGSMVQAHYQLINTLQLSRDEVHTLLKPSLDYVNLLNTDVEVLKYHVKCSDSDGTAESASNVFKSKTDIVYTMLKLSKDFHKTKYFYDFKKEACKAYLKNIKKGHILIDGNYSVLFGNPYEMLLHSIGRFDGTTSLPPGHIHTGRYGYGERVLGCRSPHISTSNVLVAVNMRHDPIDTYFNLTDEIVCLNAIGENIMERLSGCDYDSDQMILSNNSLLIEAALKNYEIFKVPANRVPANKVQRYYTNRQKSDLDYRTSENKIGEIVNLSQELNTLMWDYINKSGKPLTDCYEDIREIYYDICILNVLSCVEIDKAKKEFDISSGKEIREIKEKWKRLSSDGKSVKPAFLGFIAQTKGYRNPEKKKYSYHSTAMDYLLQETNRFRSKKTDAKSFLPLSECFRFPDFNQNSVNWKQLHKIIKLCEAAAASINAVWAKDYYAPSEKYILAEQYREALFLELQALKLNRHTMFILLTYMDMPKYSHISKLLFYILFHYKNNVLIDLMNHLDRSGSYIAEALDGDIDIYGIKFRKYGGRTNE